MTTAPARRPVLGTVSGLASAAAFATSGAFAKSLLLAGWSPGLVVALRVTVAALALAPALAWSLRGRARLLLRNARTVLAYGATGVALTQLAYFSAVERLSVGVALLLEYLAPVLVVAWLWARRGVRPSRLTVAGAVVSLAGLVLVLDLRGDVRLDAVGVAWALVAAAALTAYFLLAESADADLPPIALAGGGLAVGAVLLWVAGALGAVELRRGAASVTLLDARVPWWLPLAVISLVAAAFAYVAGIAAVRALGSTPASFLALSEVVFAVAVAWAVLGELPSAVQLGGGALVVAGIVAVRAGSRAPLPGD
ncbi:MAG: DMT family transporter [Kineosporiaceae bacterium]